MGILYSILPGNNKQGYYVTVLQRRLFAVERTNVSVLYKMCIRDRVWGEKVSRIVNSILQRYEKEGDALLEHTNIYVCDICGFIYIGDTPPALCPVCKVPGWKMTKVERGQAG